MKIAMLLSGGVDSTVALARLVQEGHQVTAFYLKIWLEDELSFLGDCPWDEDLSYVKKVCEQFNVPLEIVPLQQAYKERVIGYTIDEIKKGNTPNPDIMCNTFIKCGAFLEALEGRDFDRIATGHYAGVIHQNGRYYLQRTPDVIKDQTYFLARLSQEQLAWLTFPLANLTKQEVRALAQEFNVINKDRKDSQGLCFLGKIKFRDFVKEQVGTKEGLLIEIETGTQVGAHEGFWFYTLGQRQGLGLAGGPWYVVAKDPSTNTVFISKQYHAEDKQRDTFTVGQLSWVDPITETITLDVKIRHGAHVYTALVTPHDDGTVTVQLPERDQGIAPGQFAVFYKDKLCIGSGVILI